MLLGLLNAVYLWPEISIPVRENGNGSFQVRMLEKQRAIKEKNGRSRMLLGKIYVSIFGFSFIAANCLLCP